MPPKRRGGEQEDGKKRATRSGPAAKGPSSPRKGRRIPSPKKGTQKDEHEEEEGRITVKKSPAKKTKEESPKKKTPSTPKKSPAPATPLAKKPVSREYISSSSSSDEEEEKKEKGRDQVKVKVVKRAATPTATPPQKKGVDEEMVNLGKQVFLRMSVENIQSLLDKVDQQCSVMDTMTVVRRERRLDWSEISFGRFNADECKAAWLFLKQQTRSFRIMSEVVQEVKHRLTGDSGYQMKLLESLPGFPQKPQIASGGFNIYNREKWEQLKATTKDPTNLNYITYQKQCRKEYDEVPKHVQEEYEQRSKDQLKEYQVEMKQFFDDHPEVAQFAARFRQLKTESKNKSRRKGDSQFGDLKPIRISKAERDKLYEDAPQPPASPAVAFMQTKLRKKDPATTDEELSELKHNLFERWKNMSVKKRARWIANCISDCAVYMHESEEYSKSHPGFVPNMKLNKILNKDDLTVWETSMGKPVSLKLSSFEIYLEEYLDSNENCDLPEKERRAIAQENWSKMDWYRKETYQLKYKRESVEYKKQLQDFFMKVPEFMKSTCLKRINKRYWKMLEEAGKVPTDYPPQERHADELLITADAGVIFGSSKPHKAKKRKHEPEEEQDAETSEPEEVFLTPKKKKKKKHKRERESSDDDVGDLRSFHQKDEAIAPTKEARQITSNYSAMLENHDRRPVYSLEDEFVLKHTASSSKAYPPNNAITRHHINETIRGIFDARAIGRKFSVFYYYAKYVAREREWIDRFQYTELESTAIDMIKTFFELPKNKQEQFIQRAERFHKAKIKSNGSGTCNFPDEPIPPPRRVAILYQREAKQDAGRNRSEAVQVPKWEDLTQATKTMYMKKLYHLTRDYMRRYEEFIMSLTPSDFVEYAIYRYRMWEAHLYTKQSVSRAVRQFSYPMATIVNDEDEVQEADTLESFVIPSTSSARDIPQLLSNNPFADD